MLPPTKLESEALRDYDTNNHHSKIKERSKFQLISKQTHYGSSSLSQESIVYQRQEMDPQIMEHINIMIVSHQKVKTKHIKIKENMLTYNSHFHRSSLCSFGNIQILQYIQYIYVVFLSGRLVLGENDTKHFKKKHDIIKQM